MARTISIGAQSFADIREHGYFLVDKTDFIRQCGPRVTKSPSSAGPGALAKRLT